MPIIPLSSLSSFQATLFAFQRQLVQHRPSAPMRNPTTAILPYCTVNPPLPEHSVNVLSDICQGFRDLAMAATTSEGQIEIKKWLSDPATEKADLAIDFWLQEYIHDWMLSSELAEEECMLQAEHSLNQSRTIDLTRKPMHIYMVLEYIKRPLHRWWDRSCYYSY